MSSSTDTSASGGRTEDGTASERTPANASDGAAEGPFPAGKTSTESGAGVTSPAPQSAPDGGDTDGSDGDDSASSSRPSSSAGDDHDDNVSGEPGAEDNSTNYRRRTQRYYRERTLPEIAEYMAHASHANVLDEVIHWFAKRHSAITNKNEEELRYVAAGIGVNGETVLHAILCQKYPDDLKGKLMEVVQLFVEVAKISDECNALKVKDGAGILPLHRACGNGTCGHVVVKALIQAYPGGVKVQDGSHDLPLHEACRSETPSLKKIAALIEAYPVGTEVQNDCKQLPLHLACMEGSHEVAKALIDAYHHGVNVPDEWGCLPLHCACASKRFSPEVVTVLIDENPAEFGRKDAHGKKPFECKGGSENFTCFFQYIAMSFDTKIREATFFDEKDLRKKHDKFMSGLRDHIPMQILKKGIVDDESLNNPLTIKWLNKQSCRRQVVALMLLQFYLHMTWICVFIDTTNNYLQQGHIVQWKPIVLLVVGVVFFFLELAQLIRFSKTDSSLSYLTDFWNWIDLITIALVTSSAAQFIKEDASIPTRSLLISTGFFLFIHFISYLKKTFFPFSQFVGGVIKILWKLGPLLIISAITLFCFAYMYYVDQSSAGADYNPKKDEHETYPYESLWESFKTVATGFAEGPEGNDTGLDFIFGIIVALVLLNVVIAVVSNEWEDATNPRDSLQIFWYYRLDFILELTRGGNEERNPAARGPGTNPFDRAYWHDLFDRVFFTHTVEGVDMFEFQERLRDDMLVFIRGMPWGRFNGNLLSVFMTGCLLVAIIIGFPTFGLTWPTFVREFLFASPRFEEEESKSRHEELKKEHKTLKDEIGKLQNDVDNLKTQIEAQTKIMLGMQKLLEKDKANDEA